MMFYEKFTCYVQVGNNTSDGFEPLQGILQGAPCSMFMFQVFINELLNLLTSSIYCITVNGVKVSCPAYADDITVLSLSSEGLQPLLSIAHKFSLKWRLSFNSDKCKVLKFGDAVNYKKKFKLGTSVI